jgi:hypothetical protein
MAMPTDIGVIDLMMGIPVSEDNSEAYEFMKPLLMDEESRNLFKMPAQYMFKDIPKIGPVADKVAWVLGHMDRHGIERAMVGLPRNPDVLEAVMAAASARPSATTGSMPSTPSRPGSTRRCPSTTSASTRSTPPAWTKSCRSSSPRGSAARDSRASARRWS